MHDRIRIVITHFQTPDLLKAAVTSLRRFYPRTKLTILDNGSLDGSKATIKEIQNELPQQTNVVLLEKNIFHGPAMHRAMNDVEEDYVFFLDSDTETRKGGFLEAMEKEIEISDTTYGVGRCITVSNRGYQKMAGITVLAPAYMMIRRSMYFDFPPFEHHGMPVLKNFIAAQAKGLTLRSFPIEDYIEHQWRGTASRFGYGLGWRAKMDFVLNKIGL